MKIKIFHKKEFGITLDNATAPSCQWKLKSSSALELVYGDVMDKQSVDPFVARVCDSTANVGVDLVVADGGFQEARNVHDQEQKMCRLVMCEIILMYQVLAPGGDFICKTFELASPFSIELLMLLTHTFESVAIVKPVVRYGKPEAHQTNPLGV